MSLLRRGGACAAVTALLWLLPMTSYCGAAAPAPTGLLLRSGARQGSAAKSEPPKPSDEKITPEQAKELFRSVDQILQFASHDTELPILHPVKRRLTTRTEVEHYIQRQMKDDKDAARLESSEIVLKKFGLLTPDFQLQPFLVSLLTEQIAGYYDSKTKTVNLLDWIPPDDQKQVMAHELTHALQDQHVDLEKWGDQGIDAVAKNVDEDNAHLRVDETDTAREAVVEGQAMVVFLDWGLAPKGQSLRKMPDLGPQLDTLDGDDAEPELKKAPLMLKESLLFPYREGLRFEQVVLKDEGAQKAFAGALDHPPSTSWEIMNPRAWEQGAQPALLTMPDIHPFLADDYTPYDVGAMGAFDVRVLAEQIAGQEAADELTPAWDGGLYYAVQSRAAKTAAEKDTTKSVALLYLSQWKTEDAAARFASIYAAGLKQKYKEVHLETQDAAESNAAESVFTTEDGPVVIATLGRGVFVSESFPLPLARRLELVMTGTLHHSGEEQAHLRHREAMPELGAGLAGVMDSFGLLRAELPR